MLLTGLLREKLPVVVTSDDHRFGSLHSGIDNMFWELRESGVGSDSKSAEDITRVIFSWMDKTFVYGVEKNTGVWSSARLRDTDIFWVQCNDLPGHKHSSTPPPPVPQPMEYALFDFNVEDFFADL